MSYQVSVYFNDENIASTQIRSGSFVNVTKYYGDDAYIADGFTNSTTFTATPANGCNFTKWYYRIGGDSDTLQESTDNPFVYSGTEDIIIHAEGEQESVVSSWTGYQMEQIDVGTIPEEVSFTLGEYEVYRYTVNFSHSGYAYFRTYGGVDTVGFLSDSPEWNSEFSGPQSALWVDDDSGTNGNFEIEWHVTAGVDYYIFIRSITGTETGNVYLEITEPWELDSSSYGTLQGAKSYSVYSSPLTLCRRAISFSKNGTVTFNVSSTSEALVYIGTTSDWYYGEPTDYDKYAYLGADLNYSFEVTAGQTYYFWCRGYYGDETQTVTLDISDVKEKISIAKWSWSASNGSNASASVTLNSFNALNKGISTSNFSHLVWMDMVDKVWDIIKATTNGWDEYYASLYDTKNLPQNSDGLYELTAAAFNSLRNNIELVGNQSSVLGYKTGIGQVLAKNTNYRVKAEYFLTLANYINDCIDNL